MSYITISTLPQSAILLIHTERLMLQLNPDYQRDSDVWTIEKRQLLVDSILNGFDIPKIYLHKFPRPKKIKGQVYSYAIVDGKQRLLSIWGFINGEFSLGDTFEFLPDKSVDAAGMNYHELGKRYPRLKLRFDSFSLPIVLIETDDIDLIEDMFSRLNEAVPLSAAEKRNAFPGPLPKVVRELVKDQFFISRVPFPNKRYRHLDLGAKLLLIEAEGKITDTKKVYLDAFVKGWKDKNIVDGRTIRDKARAVLTLMTSCFIQDDPLLRSVGMIVLYYHLFRLAKQDGWAGKIRRSVFKTFEEQRAANKEAAEKDIATADYDLLEFDRLVQSPNDAFATTARLEVLLKKCFGRTLPRDYGA